jgi:hypothetical protein
MRAKSGGLPLAVGDWAVIRLVQQQVQAGLWDWIVLTWSYLLIAVVKPCFRYRPTLLQVMIPNFFCVKGVDGWFERLTRALEVIEPCNPNPPVHPNITGGGAFGLIDLVQPTVSQQTTKANETAINISKTTISPERVVMSRKWWKKESAYPTL